MTAVYIATEDALSEAIADRLIEEENQGMYVAVRLGKKGNGYLKKNVRSFIKIARSMPVLLLTDLDSVECPSSLINDWTGKKVLPYTFIFRVAVRETEAWLLADREGFAQFSGVPLLRIPKHPELIDDPKQILLNLVRRYGRSSVKADILPERGSTARVGIAYNLALCSFVHGAWSSERAAQTSVSLDRVRCRLHELRLAVEKRRKNRA